MLFFYSTLFLSCLGVLCLSYSTFVFEAAGTLEFPSGMITVYLFIYVSMYRSMHVSIYQPTNQQMLLISLCVWKWPNGTFLWKAIDLISATPTLSTSLSYWKPCSRLKWIINSLKCTFLKLCPKSVRQHPTDSMRNYQSTDQWINPTNQ